MLTTARPIFEHVPAAFADPSGLADQQAPGVVSLVVVRYDAAPAPQEPAQGPEPPAAAPGAPGPRAAVYDAFVAVSGQLLAVARTTPDYRFPVTPATALARFHDARDAPDPSGGGGPATGPTLSLYAVGDDDCARFLETAFYAECLKLHVDGPASAPLVAAQLARATGCATAPGRCPPGAWPPGVLEVNDFSDPRAPHVALLDLADLVSDGGPGALADALAHHLDGVAGRVLLYDREKNRATLPDRAGHGFDLAAAIEQADRLATARRAARDRPPPEPDDAPLPDPAETALLARTPTARAAADAPAPAAPAHPAAASLSALVAELQTVQPAAPLAAPATDDDAPPSPATQPGAVAPARRGDHEPTAAPEQEAGAPADAPPPAQPEAGHPAAAAAPPHPLATDLDRLRADVVALFEDAVGRDRAQAHHAHVVGTLGLGVPVPPGRTVEYVRALLTADPPRRWHLFKRARGRVSAEVAAKLLAFHAAHAHADEPVGRAAVQEVARLWTRLHR